MVNVVLEGPQSTVLLSFKPGSATIVAPSVYKFRESRTKYLKGVQQGKSVSKIGVSPIPTGAEVDGGDLPRDLSRARARAATAEATPQ
jgi:hypothetical protein